MGNTPLICLSNGHKMPMIGLGTWQSDSAESEKALSDAIDIGYRLFDTAASYMNEDIIGRVIKKYLAMGNLKRDEFFITTKIWPTYLHPDRQLAHFQESLKKLDTPYVDLLLAHQPTCYELDGVTLDPSVTVEQIWLGLEKIYKMGLAKAIGVSNWSIEQMERARKVATVPIHAAQVECHIYLPQHELVDYCRKHKIIVTSYGSLGSPARKVPFLGRVLDFADSPNMFEEPAVKEIAEKYKRTPAQVLLRYLLDRQICVIPKSASRDRLKSNLDVVEFHLDADDIAKLDAVPHRQRLFMQEHMKGHPEDSFAAERS